MLASTCLYFRFSKLACKLCEVESGQSGRIGHAICTYHSNQRVECRVWCRFKDWKPVHIELVGLSRIKNARALDIKRVILPSDHFGIYTVIAKKASSEQGT